MDLSAHDLETLQQSAPAWLYYGTLFASTVKASNVLVGLGALKGAAKFSTSNLRPGSDSPELVIELLGYADVVKLNEEELQRVHEFAGLPLDTEAFCREGSAAMGGRPWRHARRSRVRLLACGQYVEAAGHPVEVVDAVGAGDAFAAAFMHGLSRNWPAGKSHPSRIA